MQRYLLEGQAKISDLARGKHDLVDSGIRCPGDITPRVASKRYDTEGAVNEGCRCHSLRGFIR